MKNKCNFVPYGEEENRCTKCNYVTWVDKNKTSEQILGDMINVGYLKPECYEK